MQTVIASAFGAQSPRSTMASHRNTSSPEQSMLPKGSIVIAVLALILIAGVVLIVEGLA